MYHLKRGISEVCSDYLWRMGIIRSCDKFNDLIDLYAEVLKSCFGSYNEIGLY